MSDAGHVPVLVDEVMALLAPRPGQVVVDGTIGRGGHALALAGSIGPSGVLVGFDVDQGNLEFASGRLRDEGLARFEAVHDSFVHAPEHMRRLGLRADVVLADLGFSSNQMEDAGRGLSFAGEGPLDMRLDPSGRVTAADLLANLSEAELADVIYQYGEEPLSRRIARKLAQTRAAKPIRSTAELAQLVVEAYGPRARKSRLHPATRTFMALRIAVNDELAALESLLEQVAAGAEVMAAGRSSQVGAAARQGSWLNDGARVAVISFHSLEDRLVKRTFADLARRGLARRLTKRPIIASERERAANPRARSAKLRAIQVNVNDPIED